MAVIKSSGNGYAIYGGTKLPNIDSVWTDKVTYPYAVIVSSSDDVASQIGAVPPAYVLYVLSLPPVYYNGKFLSQSVTNGLFYYTDSANNSWLHYGELGTGTITDNEGFNNYGGSVIFTSADIVSGTLSGVTFTPDGSVYLAGSDQIPLDGMTVIEWDGDTNGLVNVDNDFYKVSEDILTESQLADSIMFVENIAMRVGDIAGTVSGDGYAAAAFYAFVSISKNNAVCDSKTFAETGLYSHSDTVSTPCSLAYPLAETDTSLTDYVIMPGADYKAACDAIRAKTGKTDLIKSGDMATEIEDISTHIEVDSVDELPEAEEEGTIAQVGDKIYIFIDGEWVEYTNGVDTSKDTVTPPTMLEGITAHDASGKPIVGTIPTYDGSAEESAAKFQEKVATANGEVTPDEGYVGLSKVVVNVEGSDGTVVIEWDGNTEGKVSASDIPFYKVSDLTPEPEELLGGVVCVTVVGSEPEVIPITEEGFEDNRSDGINAVGFGGNVGIVVYEDNVDLDGNVFPESGIYFVYGDDNGTPAYVSSLTYTPSNAPVLQEKTVTENGEVTPDEGYVGLSKVVVDVESNDGTVTIEWDGDTTGKVIGTGYEEGNCVVKVSDLTPDAIELVDGVLCAGTYDSEHESITITTDDIYDLRSNGFNIAMIGILQCFIAYEDNMVVDGKTFPEKGTYFLLSGDYYVSSLTYTPSNAPVLQEKTVTANGVVTADDGYDGLSKVTVNVPNDNSLFRSVVTREITELTAEDLDGITKIGSGAFRSCTELASVAFPSTLTYIGTDAFYGCSGLTSITIPKGVTTVMASAFNRCSGLESITVESGNINYSSVGNCLIFAKSTIYQGCKNSVIPSDSSVVSRIGACAFEKITDLTSIVIPSNIVFLGEGAFRGCSGLELVDFRSATSVCGIYAEDGSVFDMCVNVNIVVPDSLYSKWIATDGWSQYADYIVKASEY